ncbi:hypothetical protein Tco_0796008 [Tanacetum coccineum]
MIQRTKTLLSEKEAIFLLLMVLGDDIIFHVDVVKTANEMWIALKGYNRQYQNEVNDIRAERIAKISKEDNDPEQAQRDMDMQKNLALLAKYFKRLYKPTNNNLQTSSNSRNKTEDTTPRYNNDNQSGQFGNQRNNKGAGTRETVAVRKPKRVKDYTYHKEKMMMYKQAEQGVPLQAEQADWLVDTDEEIDENRNGSTLQFHAKIRRQHSENNTAECADERVALANLIAKLNYDTRKIKTILKQFKASNNAFIDSEVRGVQN